MNNSWFTVKLKYLKELDNGVLKNVTEPFVVDAVSFTDAESRIVSEIGSTLRGEYLITGITKTDYADIFLYEDSDDWYKCKITYETIDGDNGKTKKISNYFLVTANNIKEAYDRIQENLSDFLVDVEIPNIALTNIVEVLPYVPNEMNTKVEQTVASHESTFEDETEL